MGAVSPCPAFDSVELQGRESQRIHEITDANVRTIPTSVPKEGVGVVEAPRGTLIHAYDPCYGCASLALPGGGASTVRLLDREGRPPAVRRRD